MKNHNMQRLKEIAIGLAAIVATLLIANAWYVWSSDTRLERQLAAIREAGNPICLADLARQPIEPEKNAATYLRRAEADADAIVKDLFELKEANEVPGRLISDAGQAKIRAAFVRHTDARHALPRTSPNQFLTGPAATASGPRLWGTATGIPKVLEQNGTGRSAGCRCLTAMEDQPD